MDWSHFKTGYNNRTRECNVMLFLSPTRYRGAREKWLDVRFQEPFLQPLCWGRSSVLLTQFLKSLACLVQGFPVCCVLIIVSILDLGPFNKTKIWKYTITSLPIDFIVLIYFSEYDFARIAWNLYFTSLY